MCFYLKCGKLILLVFLIFCLIVGDQSPYVWWQLKNNDGGWEADSETSIRQSDGQITLRLQFRLVIGGNHLWIANG